MTDDLLTWEKKHANSLVTADPRRKRCDPIRAEVQPGEVWQSLKEVFRNRAEGVLLKVQLLPGGEKKNVFVNQLNFKT